MTTDLTPNKSHAENPNATSTRVKPSTPTKNITMPDPKPSAAGGDADHRKTWDLDEYAAKAKKREAAEKEEAKARYEAKLAGKKYYKPLTGDETFTRARGSAMDVSAMIGKTQLVGAGAGVGKRGRGAGFYCDACDLTFKDNKQFVEHQNSTQHLANTGAKGEVQRATVEDVRARIECWARKRDEDKKNSNVDLGERLKMREEEMEKEREEKRAKKREEREKVRKIKEEEERERVGYGEGVRVEGEHDQEDMMAQMGFTNFGTTK